jgi:hypothetical protein
MVACSDLWTTMIEIYGFPLAWRRDAAAHAEAIQTQPDSAVEDIEYGGEMLWTRERSDSAFVRSIGLSYSLNEEPANRKFYFCDF